MIIFRLTAVHRWARTAARRFSFRPIKAVLLTVSISAIVSSSNSAASDLAELPVVSTTSSTFEGAELSRIEKTLGITVGRPVDTRRMNEGIQTLYKQGRLQSVFVEAIPEGKGIRLALRGTRIRKLRKLRSSGIDEDLWDEVRRKGSLEEGEFIDTRTISTLKERLKTAYEARGYPFAEVRVLINDVPDGQDADVEVYVAKGEPTMVSKLVVTGASPEENATLRNLVPLKTGAPYSKPTLEAATEKITRYLRANQYPTAKVIDTATTFSPDRRAVEINIMVKLGSRYQFIFEGNTVFDELSLRDLLTEELLSQADAVQKITELVQGKYRAVGFHFVAIDSKSMADEAQGLTVVRFIITEGAKVLIDGTTFSGGESIGNGKIEGMFYDGATGVLARHVFWEEGIKPAVLALTQQLESMGYLSAAVNGPRTIFSDDKKGVQLFFDVDLGTQTRVGAIEIEGNSHVPREKVEELVAVKSGEPLNRARVEDTRKRIQNYYASQGYVDMRFAEADTNESIGMGKDARSAAIKLHVSEGTEYHVGNVTLEGNKKTKSEVILREVKVKKGDKFDPNLVRRSEEDISFLGLFSRVELVSSNNPGDPTAKDIKIIVRETRPGVGELGLGGYYEDPRLRVKGFAGVAYRNLFGLNQTLSTRTELALPLSPAGPRFIPFIEYGALLGYRAPYPFELPFHFITEVGLDRHEISPDEVSVQTRARLEERIERKLSKSLTGIYRLHHFERTRTEKLNPKNASDPARDVTETIGSTGPGIILDFRDDIFNPTRGSFHTLDLELAHNIIGSQSAEDGHQRIAFVEVISRNSFYVPLFGPLSFTFFTGVGYAKSLYGDPLPQARLLYNLSLGGQNSIRGFTPNRFTLSTSPTPVVETGYYNVRAELRTELFANVSAAVFLDSGQLLHSAIWPTRHDGVGIGFRYKTPVGPVVIDVAQGLGPDKESVRFYFTIGTF